MNIIKNTEDKTLNIVLEGRLDTTLSRIFPGRLLTGQNPEWFQR